MKPKILPTHPVSHSQALGLASGKRKVATPKKTGGGKKKGDPVPKKKARKKEETAKKEDGEDSSSSNSDWGVKGMSGSESPR